MKALVFDGRLHLDPAYPDPEPGPGEVRIRTLLASICNTDLEIIRGYAAFCGVVGHEFVGVVDRIAKGADPALLGRRVVADINAGCGECSTCRSGLPQHCAHRTALGIRGRDGALAEYFCLPAANLFAVPGDLPDQVAVFVEPLAAACEVLQQVHVRPADSAAVLGDGKLGLLVAQVLALTGCHVTAVGHHPENLAILSARGIDTHLDLGGHGTADPAVDGDSALPALADVVVDCTGQPAGLELAQRLVRPRGTIILKSTYEGHIPTNLSALAVSEVRVVGSRCGPFAPALRLLAHGLVDVLPLISAEYPLDQAVEAVGHASRPGALKILVRPASPD